MKNILITGGTRGIGACVAELFSDWNAIPLGRKDVDMEHPLNVVNYLAHFPENVHLDALVFSHGEWFSREFPHHPEVYLRQYLSRVVEPLKIIDHFAKHLQLSPVGVVVFVSSTRGFIGGVNTAPYSLACAAQIALVQGFSREFEGVRFNVVCPGLTDTDLGKEVVRTGGAKADAIPQDPKTVAREIHRLIEERENGKVVRVVDGKASEAKWNW